MSDSKEVRLLQFPAITFTPEALRSILAEAHRSQEIEPEAAAGAIVAAVDDAYEQVSAIRGAIRGAVVAVVEADGSVTWKPRGAMSGPEENGA